MWLLLTIPIQCPTHYDFHISKNVWYDFIVLHNWLPSSTAYHVFLFIEFYGEKGKKEIWVCCTCNSHTSLIMSRSPKTSQIILPVSNFLKSGLLSSSFLVSNDDIMRPWLQSSWLLKPHLTQSVFSDLPHATANKLDFECKYSEFGDSASCACENLQMPEECWGLINIPIIITLIISPRCFCDCPVKECLSKFYLHLFGNIDAQWINAVHGCQCWRLIKSMCEPDALIEKSAATKLGLNKHFTVVL